MLITNLKMPPMYCPIEGARHPDADAVERHAITWIDQAGFIRTPTERAWTIATSSADFYARFAPYASFDGLLTAALWVYWGFAFDDAFCDEGRLSTDPAAFTAVAGRVQRALERPGTPPGHLDEPYARAVHDIGERFRATATPVQVRRFVDAHRAWLTGVVWQIGNRARGHMPDLDEYLTMRLHSAGGEPTYAMLEMANGLEIPAAETDSPAVRALTEMAIAVAALDNDRFSLAKEANRTQPDQNIFTVLAHHDACPLPEAVPRGVGLRDRILDRFLQVRQRLAPTASDALRRYLADLGHGIRGNIEWSISVARYLSLNAASQLPEHATHPAQLTWTDRPLVAADQPSPPPSVAWWWDDTALTGPDREEHRP